MFQAEFIPPRASFPSPFSLLYYIAKGAYVWKQKKCCRNPDIGKKDEEGQMRKKIKYFKLLNELIQRRKQMEDNTK